VKSPSGMRAGLFQDRRNVSSPPDIESKAFRKEAVKHFSWTQEATPFISTYENTLPVLHHGPLLTSDASIAVIDLAEAVLTQKGLLYRSYNHANLPEPRVLWLLRKIRVVGVGED